LGAKISDNIPEILKAEVVKEEVVIDKEPPPPPPDIKPPPPDFVPPPQLDFAVDAPVNSTAIVNTQATKAAPAPVVEAALTKPKPAGKGLSRAEYPAASIRAGEEGVVGLNLYILETGKVGEAKVATSSGFERLDEAARKHAERSWKFVPCMKGEVPTACWYQMNVRMKIEDEKK
jgi:protein TonB